MRTGRHTSTRTSGARSTVRRFVAGTAMAVAAATTLAACGPPPPPRPPTTTTTPAPTTTAAPAVPAIQSVASCDVDFRSPANGGGSATAAGSDSPAVGADGPSGAALEAMAAGAADATEPGDDVVITTVDPVTGHPDYRAVDPDHAVDAAAMLDAAAHVEVVGVEAPSVAVPLVAAQSSSGDPLRWTQWALNSLAIEAVDHCTTGAGAKVAVIDTGANVNHVDLAGNVVAGPSIIDRKTVAGGGGMDVGTHGTHVTGTIAAVTGNGIGIAGAADGAETTSIRVFETEGGAFNSDVARAITWAVDDGADVINLSLGSVFPSPAISAAIDQATANNTIVVAAAGNGGKHGAAFYPAAFDDVIAVGSHTSTFTPSGFTTHGAYVDVAAPGSAVHSTVHTTSYDDMSGTSMASPHVAAVVARMRSVDPTLTVDEIRAALTSTAINIGAPGFDHASGHGRVHVPSLWDAHRVG